MFSESCLSIPSLTPDFFSKLMLAVSGKPKDYPGRRKRNKKKLKFDVSKTMKEKVENKDNGQRLIRGNIRIV